MLLGKRVVAVDLAAHSVTTDAGETIGYGKLVWATGGVTCSRHGAEAWRDRIGALIKPSIANAHEGPKSSAKAPSEMHK